VSELVQHLVNGISLGTIYALIALGYTMVYGVLKLINFAHGDIYMVGAFAGYYLARGLGVTAAPSLAKTVVVFVGSMAVCGLLGFVIERVAYRPLRARPRLTALITAIGISFLLEYGFQLPQGHFLPFEFPPGPTPRFFPTLFERTIWLTIADVPIANYDLLALLVAVAFMVGLDLVVYRTRFGTAMRAVSFDPSVARLMGISVDRIISGTFIIGSMLASVAALLVAVSRPRIEPLMGLMPGLKAFVAAVFGGIGHVPGAMVGGLLLGLAEEFVAGYTVSSYRDAIAFAILIVVLLVKPSGLFGRATKDKV
jgi:branched-chain amino acid transport system permease protein